MLWDSNFYLNSAKIVESELLDYFVLCIFGRSLKSYIKILEKIKSQYQFSKNAVFTESR